MYAGFSRVFQSCPRPSRTCGFRALRYADLFDQFHDPDQSRPPSGSSASSASAPEAGPGVGNSLPGAPNTVNVALGGLKSKKSVKGAKRGSKIPRA